MCIIINNNNNMLNELYSINLIFYNKCKKIADNLNVFNNNVTNDYIACYISNNTYSYTNNNNIFESKGKKKYLKKKPKIFTFEENIDQEKKNIDQKDEKKKVTYLDNINSRINLQL